MPTVYVGLSGGVDSSVSAALLKQQGYNVVGVYMKNWTADVAGVACPWKIDLADARAAAAVLDISFKVFDFQDQYREKVVEAMVAEYAAGRTPNPDVLCNQEIKFKLFLELALADGADYIATGHYAKTDGNGRLLRAYDDAKDQTYFLYRVTGEALKRTIFPVGEIEKPEVRRLAATFNLPAATKPDSQGICFVGEVGIRPFLEQYIPPVSGHIIDKAGHVVGTHSGAAYYTIGQRQGLGVGGDGPYYVTARDVATNTVTITDNPDDLQLSGDEFKLDDPHWINDTPPPGDYLVRLRHRGELVPMSLEDNHNTWSVRLHTSQRAIAAGQSAVIYDGETVLGGGFIAF
ncbi:tRNA 2-thiouridine(34) synthase MnmA [Candidatus Saccharibacteria bacterium]|nr:tRNA 2-thiouridine(34) synthase MnmA [Candidatus Saccharibacteria bacterium]